MPTLKIKNADGVDVYLKVGGGGTEVDPYIPIQEMITEEFTADETNIVSEYLTNGASNNQNVDGSVSPIEFKSSPVPVGKKFICTRIMVYMEDSSTFSSEKFGGLPVLVNGWRLALNGQTAFTAKDNKELAIFMFDITGNSIFGKENQTLVGRFSFSKFTNGADGITIREGETISSIINDDLTGLDHLNIMCQGIYKDI